MSEKPERFDVRLSEEEKRRLAELAEQRGISMTDLVKTWIARGDVVHVLAEQLQDFVNDFDKWHVSKGGRTSILFLNHELHGRIGGLEDESKGTILFDWTNFFRDCFQILKSKLSDTKTQLGSLTKQDVRMSAITKPFLILAIVNFTDYVVWYHDVFIRGFLNILKNMDEKTKQSFGGSYNDELRTRYNEIASKYEDFLKRAERELGEKLARAIPRAKEFRVEK